MFYSEAGQFSTRYAADRRLFRLRQGVLGAAGLQGGVGGNGRMFVRAAQRAGFARLQRLAVRLQAVDALLLRQHLAAAGHQLGLADRQTLGGITCTQTRLFIAQDLPGQVEIIGSRNGLGMGIH